MPYDFLNNNPLLADMSPEKLQFLMNFATAKKPNDIKEMMPFLLSAMNSAKSNNIQFSEPETDLLFQILKQNMSAEESAKADKIMNLKERLLKPLLLLCSVLFFYQIDATVTSSTLSIGELLLPLPSVPSK